MVSVPQGLCEKDNTGKQTNHVHKGNLVGSEPGKTPTGQGLPTIVSRQRRGVFVTDNGLVSREHASMNAAKMTLANILLNGFAGPGKRSQSKQMCRQDELRKHYLQNFYDAYDDKYKDEELTGEDTFDDSTDRDNTGEIASLDEMLIKQLLEKRNYDSRDDLGYKSRIKAGEDVAKDRQVLDQVFGSKGAGKR